jgi:hypothetical protein
VLLACFVLAAAACGGDDDDDSNTPSEQEQRDLLTRMVLTEGDLPDGLVELNRSFTNNDESARGAADPQAELEKFETWGRVLGLSVAFVLSPDAEGPQTFLAVQSDASLYGDAQGCHLSYEDDVDRAKQADWATSFPELTEVRVAELDVSEIGGDEAYWLRVVGKTQSEQPELKAIDLLVLRVDRVRAFMRVEAEYLAEAPADSGRGQTLIWAQIVEARMRQELGV